MSQTINLNNTETQSDTYTPEQFDYNNIDETPVLPMTEPVATDRTLRLQFPSRVLFSIKETATILNVCYEFVRSRTVSQIIPSVEVGNRRMVRIEIINDLVNNGVK